MAFYSPGFLVGGGGQMFLMQPGFSAAMPCAYGGFGGGPFLVMQPQPQPQSLASLLGLPQLDQAPQFYHGPAHLAPFTASASADQFRGHSSAIVTMYHGTTYDAARSIQADDCFRRSSDGMLGAGVYTSRDIQKARRYPIHSPGQVVFELRVSVGRACIVDHQGHPLQKSWRHHGYDSAHCPPNCGMTPSGLEEDCIWDPADIEIVRRVQL